MIGANQISSTSSMMIMIMIMVAIVFVCKTAISNAVAINTLDASQHKQRIFKKQLSDSDHYQHQDGGGDAETHNRDYDHEAFLGSNDEAEEFDKLTPEDSKARLGTIVDRIDADHDGNITETELKQWIQRAQRRYIVEDVERQWQTHTDLEPNVKAIKWESFRNKTYGFIDEMAATRKADDLKTYAEMLKRDQRRWTHADIDGDGALNRDEFVLFLHPEEDARMHSVVVEETLEDIDRDGDGRVSESEYISDMYAPEDEHAQYVPEWVTREREQFHQFRDKNKDGYLDRGEIREWIVPTNFDNIEAEAKHLLHEADKNGDGVLSKQEIIDNYDVFVGSQATDFGEALTRHDEF